MLHPAPALAFALVAVNDLWLKAHHPGWLSGKLSDLGLCFLLPVFLVAVGEWGAWVVWRLRRRGHWRAGLGPILLACVVAGAYFAALQLWPVAAVVHVRALHALAPGRGYAVTPDPSDLLALIAVPLAFLHLARRRGGTP